jgi:hypothetical protein
LVFKGNACLTYNVLQKFYLVTVVFRCHALEGHFLTEEVYPRLLLDLSLEVHQRSQRVDEKLGWFGAGLVGEDEANCHLSLGLRLSYHYYNIRQYTL